MSMLMGLAIALAAVSSGPEGAPRPADVGTLDGMIRAYYEVVSGPAGAPRDWARDRTLYIPNIRLVNVDTDADGRPVPKIMSHAEFVEGSRELEKRGFFEKEIHRLTRRYGPIAQVWSTYESRQTEAGPVTQRGVNSLELFWDGKRWWISGAIWTDETKANPIPREFLPE